MIMMLMKLGLSGRAAKAVAYIAIPLLIAASLFWALDSYGDRRFAEGRAAEAKAWKAAEAKLLKKAANAETKADKQAAARVVEHAAEVAEEREKIDQAVAEGSSVFDVMFGEGR